MKKLLFLALLFTLIASCKKDLTIEDSFNTRVQDVLTNQKTQLATDDALIKKYITEKNLTAQSTPEGIYFVIEEAGLGTDLPNLRSTVLTKYKGYLLNGTVFDQSATGISFGLTQVILGWGIGMQKFKRRSKGKLLIPSSFAYGASATGGIPANSVLVFDIELVDFN